MPKPTPTTAQPTPKKRGWFRRAVRWLLVLALLAAIFHRPLFHHGVRFAIRTIAARLHLKADLHLSGSIFTNLTLTGVHAEPVGAFPNPLRKLDIARVRLDYNLPRLFQRGLGELLTSFEISDADLVLIPPPRAKTDDELRKRPAPSLGEILNVVLGLPALYSDRVKIDNFNLHVRAGPHVTDIRALHLLLDPQRPGTLLVRRLQVPAVPVSENLAAETSYTGRRLIIRNLQLAPELAIEEFEFDASQRAQKTATASIQIRAFGGTVAASLAGSKSEQRGKTAAKHFDNTLTGEAAGISIDRTLAYFNAPKLPFQFGTLGKLSVHLTGEPEKPRTWQGDLGLSVEGTTFGKLKIDGTDLAATFQNGRADVTGVNVGVGQDSAALTAQITLPESVKDFPKTEVDGALKLVLPDLAVLTVTLSEPLNGTITGGGPIALRAGKISTDLALDAAKLTQGKISVGSGRLLLKAAKRIDTPGLALFDALESDVTADLTDLRVDTFAVDAVKLRAANQNALVTLHTLEVRRAENSVTAHGTYEVPRDFKDAAKAPVNAEFAIKVPKLADFGIATNGETLAGQLAGTGALKMVNGALAGGVTLSGGDFQLGAFTAPSLAVKIAVADNTATIEQFALKLSGTDQITASGKAGVHAPFPYEAATVLDIRNLAALQPLLAVFKVQQAVAGSLHAEWSGKGEDAKNGTPLEQSGTLSVALEKGRFDKTEISEIKLAGLYGPGFAQTTELHLASGPTDFTGALELKEGKLRLRDINLTQAKTTVLTGFVFLPFDLANKPQPFPLDGRLAANLNATRLDLEKLLASFGHPAPVSGNFTANLVAGGTLLAPLGHLKLNATGLRTRTVAGLDPAALDLDLHYSNKELTLASVLRQPQIRPLTIRGRVPLDLDATIKNKKLDPTLPLDLTVQLPASPLAILPRFVPQIRRIDGTATIDMRVTGSVEKPVLSGSAALDLTGARMLDVNIPALGAFRARLAFANDTLSFPTFQGELGGGTFRLGGTVRVPKLTEPVFDLRLTSKEVLLKRDDSITIRADTDITVTGPLAAGRLGGTLWLTQSRFFKEIDILPIGLPIIGTRARARARARPAPRAVQNRFATISFPQPPLRDWTFDLAIKTRPKDSFLVRGNLASGASAIDLKLAGTGLAPFLEGSVRIEEFRATLPFSTLNVTRGFVTFSPDAPFQPTLDIQAESQIRDHLVRAFIFGRATEPQLQLSSEPPLPYGDIVSLLATGTTISELGGNTDVLASRAAMLALQQLYRKIFRRNPPWMSQAGGDPGAFADRFQVDLGALDNRTGGQEVSARFRMTDDLFLLGEIGVDGSFTGSLKYLIRFR